MNTETTMHGYQIIRVPRSNGRDEALVRTPYAGGDYCMDARQLDTWIRQLEWEIEVARTAMAMITQEAQP